MTWYQRQQVKKAQQLKAQRREDLFVGILFGLFVILVVAALWVAS